jgi:AP endonuclease-2
VVGSHNIINIFLLEGVATYCKDAFTPFRAEEGLSGLFSSSNDVDSVGCYGSIRAEFSKMELKELDSEGRAVITQHKIKVSYVTLIQVFSSHFVTDTWMFTFCNNCIIKLF